MPFEFTKPITPRVCETDYEAPAVVDVPESSADSTGEGFGGMID